MKVPGHSRLAGRTEGADYLRRRRRPTTHLRPKSSAGRQQERREDGNPSETQAGSVQRTRGEACLAERSDRAIERGSSEQL